MFSDMPAETVPVDDGTGLCIAERLDAHNTRHLKRTAEIIKAGGIVAFPFNGIFGLFGDIDNIQASDKIVIAKNRPRDKKLIAVFLPEQIEEFADLKRTHFSKEQIIDFWKDIHALGIIFPASTYSPYHLTIGEGVERTILAIWTEYKPLRLMMRHFLEMGGRGLVGTSANKSGQVTHYDPDELWNDFQTDVHAIVWDRFDDLPEIRRRSTSVIDLTNRSPRLHRAGNVPEEEIAAALARHNFPKLFADRDVITVRARK